MFNSKSATIEKEEAPSESNATLGMIEREKDVRKHVGGHLIQIFLLALPYRADVQELGSETKSLQARSTVLGLQDVVLEFSDEAEDSASVPSPGETPLDEVGEWNFVEKDLVAKGIRKVYAGHEVDHCLKSFVNKLGILLNDVQASLPPPEIVCYNPEGKIVSVQYELDSRQFTDTTKSETSTP